MLIKNQQTLSQLANKNRNIIHNQENRTITALRLITINTLDTDLSRYSDLNFGVFTLKQHLYFVY